jgi:hypothetical protein
MADEFIIKTVLKKSKQITIEDNANLTIEVLQKIPTSLIISIGKQTSYHYLSFRKKFPQDQYVLGAFLSNVKSDFSLAALIFFFK